MYPGINTPCNDNNCARIGYLVNLWEQNCHQANDADSPIGIGLKTSEYPGNINAPFGEYAIGNYGTRGDSAQIAEVDDRMHQSWLFVAGNDF